MLGQVEAQTQSEAPIPKVVMGEGVDPSLSVDPAVVANTMQELGIRAEAMPNTTVYVGGKNNVSRLGFQISKESDRRVHGNLSRNEGEGWVVRTNTVLRGKQRTTEDINKTLVHELEHVAQSERHDPKILLGNIAILGMFGAGLLVGNRIGKKMGGSKIARVAAPLLGAAIGLQAGYSVAPHEIQARARASEIKSTAIDNA